MAKIRNLFGLFVLVASLPTVLSLDSTPALQRYCYASSLSYLGVEKITSKEYAKAGNLRPLSQLVEPVTQSGCTIFEIAGAEDDALVVAFRGSANVKNFLTNLRFKLVPLQGHPTAKVHEGFQEASQGLWALLKPDLESLTDSGRPVIFTGHSLGGATAQLCALAAGPETVAELVTFGGPLIGLLHRL